MLMLLLLAAVSPADGKTMASDDWHALAITGVGETDGALYLQAHAGDLDGDGLPDDAVLKLVCGDGSLTQSSFIVSPRDSGSGMPTGRRQHKPVTFVKEWGAASPELREMKPTYDVKTIKGARTAADGWTELTLSNADRLCSAASAAVVKTKTKSNQSND